MFSCCTMGDTKAPPPAAPPADAVDVTGEEPAAAPAPAAAGGLLGYAAAAQKSRDDVGGPRGNVGESARPDPEPPDAGSRGGNWLSASLSQKSDIFSQFPLEARRGHAAN